MLELKKHGEYKILDLWIRIFLFGGRLFSKSWHNKIVKNYHTLSVVTNTLYSPIHLEPSDQLLEHELKHVEQRERDGLFLFALRYICSRNWRLRYEVEAYRHDGREFEQIVDLLSSGAYLFYGWNRQTIRKKAVQAY